MTTHSSDDFLFSRLTEIEEAVRRGVRDALLMHKRAGNPIAAWKDGKVVIIPPEEIVVDVAHSEKR